MKPTFIALLALFLSLPMVAADKNKPLPKDFKSLKALAEKGDARAQNELGERYFYGQGVLVNKGTSVTWYRKAAEQEYAEAQYNLGWMYWAGKGVKKDFRVAVGWFYKSAVQGFAKSQHYLGGLYWRGEGVKKDLAGAYYWLSIAAAGGHKKSIEWKPMLGRELAPAQKANIDKAARNWLAQHSMSQSVLAAGVLSQAETPAENTSQGLYIRILKEAGMEARAVSAEAVKAGALEKLDIFIIGGGSGTTFSQSLGRDGGAKVEAFVKAGGGVLASCAGGYAFVRGYNEAHPTHYLEIANAVCLDIETDRWARGAANVQVAPAAEGLAPLTMYYANGALWKITEAPGFGRTVALAHYVTDVKKKGDPGGTMPGTPAILAGTFGEGRYVLFSGHPEFYKKLGNHPMIVDAARWVVRRKLAAEEKIDYRSVFPSMLPDKKLIESIIAKLKKDHPKAELVTTKSGLQYMVTKAGTGDKVGNGKKIKAHYTGKLLDGKVFDSSVKRGVPFEFTVGRGQVIKGWDEALSDMKKGEKRTLIIPSALAYGPRGSPPAIPPAATLVFEVELVDF